MTRTCDRPGCGGTYAADGYCDECGHKAPATASTAGAASGAVSGAAAASTGKGTKATNAKATNAKATKAKATKAKATKAKPDGPVSASVRPGTSPVTGAGLRGVSGAGVSGPVVSGATGTSRTRTGGRGRLGANLVAVPPIPLRDPTTAVKSDPQVPETQRFCATCNEPVGRSRDGKPGRVEGFCPKDRTPFSFIPRLSPGDRVDGRYEILGALAHGGLGWIYLARDRNISDSGADRWVVLKGLINTGDPDALASAMAERRFLVEVDHPNIVKIHDFAQHPDPKTGESVGYIVMEYVGGRSLKELALAHTDANGKRSPLPLEQVLAYGIEVLPAISYLHERGLLFCDFKPDNVIHAEEQLKLIDLGAVRRIDDQTSALWGTPGYQAPELGTHGASIASDIYTVGRTLAVLSFDFGGFSTKYASSLPDPGDVELLASQESFHRLLLRATHLDPGRRFGSAGELAEQALGVLREVLAVTDGAPRPAVSTQFTPERRVFGAATARTAVGSAVAGAGTIAGGAGAGAIGGLEIATALPVPLVDPTDPGAGFIATLGGGDAAGTVAELRAAPVSSPEVGLRLVRALVEAGDAAGATEALAAVVLEDGDWRRDWYDGLIALAASDPTAAVPAFDAVYSALPGEPAARLAVAVAAELSGDRDGAIERYLRVWRVDHSFVSAAFGLARTLLAAGNRADAVAILDEVPDSSSQYVAAQIAAIRTTVDSSAGALTEEDLVAASGRLERLRLDQARRANLAVEMLRGALAWVTAAAPVVPAAPTSARAVLTGAVPAGTAAPTGSVEAALPARTPWAQVVRESMAAQAVAPKPTVRFLGEALQEHDVRRGLERAYRTLASLEPDPVARYALVDQANAVRPRTVV